jgi:hypothetical protein
MLRRKNKNCDIYINKEKQQIAPQITGKSL